MGRRALALAAMAVGSLVSTPGAASSAPARWSAPQQLYSGFGLLPLPGIDARGNAVVAFESYQANQHGGPIPGTTRLMLSERPAGRRFGRAHQVGRTGSLTPQRLAENPAGAVAILFRADSSSCAHPRVEEPCRSAPELLYRPPGGRFGRAETVGANASQFGGDPAALGLDRHGNVTVVWTDFARRKVLAAFRPAHGHFERAQALGPRGSHLPDLAVNARGDAVAAWAEPSGHETPRGTPLFRVRAAFRAAGRSRFGGTRTVSRPAEVGQVAAGEGPDRDSIVAWIAFGPEGPPPTYTSVTYASAAHRPFRGRFGAPQVLGRADVALALAFDPGGKAVAYWTRAMCATPCPGPGDVHFIPQASFRSRGQAFGPVFVFDVQDAPAQIEPDGRGGWLAVLERMERGGPTHGVLAMTAGPRGPFTSPTTITTEPAYGGAALATNAHGDAVVAWNANGKDSRVQASILGP